MLSCNWLDYLKLYRLDAALLSFMGYTFGAIVGGTFGLLQLLPALFISLISLNSVYVLNAWADWKIDKINKPDRPLPKGDVSLDQAYHYALTLILLAVALPLILTNSLLTLLLFLLIPGLGLAYSLRPLRLKRNVVAADLVTSSLYILPLLIGYLNNSNDLVIFYLAAPLFLYALAIVPLKDIGDKSGDLAYGCDNWLDKLTNNGLLLLTDSLLIVDLFLTYLMPLGWLLKSFIWSLIGASLIILTYYAQKETIVGVYSTMIKTIITVSALFICFYGGLML